MQYENALRNQQIDDHALAAAAAVVAKLKLKLFIRTHACQHTHIHTLGGLRLSCSIAHIEKMCVVVECVTPTKLHTHQHKRTHINACCGGITYETKSVRIYFCAKTKQQQLH